MGIRKTTYEEEVRLLNLGEGRDPEALPASWGEREVSRSLRLGKRQRVGEEHEYSSNVVVARQLAGLE